MSRVVIFGGTGRLGTALAERLKARGDEVHAFGQYITTIPEAVNYAIFCQRCRGTLAGEIMSEFTASVAVTDRALQTIGWADEEDCAAVLVSSVYGVGIGPNHGAGYHVGKAAQIHLMKFHAARLGVRVNCVSPWGFTGEKPPIEMREVVDVIEFLCSPKSSGLNGQNIVIDKGLKWAA